MGANEPAPELSPGDLHRELAESTRRFDLIDLRGATFRRLLLLARDEGLLPELLGVDAASLEACIRSGRATGHSRDLVSPPEQSQPSHVSPKPELSASHKLACEASFVVTAEMIESGRIVLWEAIDEIGPTDARILAERVFTGMLKAARKIVLRPLSNSAQRDDGSSNPLPLMV